MLTTAAVENPPRPAPMDGVRTVIHRDYTFEYDGRRYALIGGGPGWGWEIVTWPELRFVADGFFTLAEVRAFVDEHRREGWELRAAGETP